MRPRHGLLALLAAVPLAAAPAPASPPSAAGSPCRSARVTPRPLDFLNLDLKEYGWLFFDALSDGCASAARDGLVRKLEGTLRGGPREALGRKDVLPFQGWLEGVHVELIHATALVLGGRGLLTPRLDRLVRKAGEQYRYGRDPACDPASTGNTCWDDQSQAAVAYAWTGAYEALAGRTGSARPRLDRAEALLAESFAPGSFLCVAPGSDALPVPCGAVESLPGALDEGRVSVAVFNHGFENMGYGVGLMTSFSSAALALELAGRPVTLSPAERAVLRSVLARGRRAATTDGSAFLPDACYRVEAGRLLEGQGCADLGYRPAMFPVRAFYDRKVGVPPGEGFGYDRFDASLFDADDPFLHLGRAAVYGHLGFSWWETGVAGGRPALSARVARQPAAPGRAVP